MIIAQHSSLSGRLASAGRDSGTQMLSRFVAQTLMRRFVGVAMRASVVCAVLVLSFASIAMAQTSGSQDSTAKATKEETQSESNNERPVSTFEDTQVRIEVDQFGVSDVARLGEWIGVKIRIQDIGTEQRTVLVRLSTTDADGDQPQQQREVTTNPGVKQDVWMYMRLPFAGIDRVPVPFSTKRSVLPVCNVEAVPPVTLSKI